MRIDISGNVLKHLFPCPPEEEKVDEAKKFARELMEKKKYDVIVVDDDVYITESNFCASNVFIYAFNITEVDWKRSIEHSDDEGWWTSIYGKGEAVLYKSNGELAKKVEGRFYINTDGDVSVKNEETGDRIGVHRKFSKWSYISEKISRLFHEVRVHIRERER